jgi:hypothetical protein
MSLRTLQRPCKEDVVSSRDLSGFRGFRWRRSLSNPSEILETSSLDYSTGIGRSSGGSLLRINHKLLHILKLVTSRPSVHTRHNQRDTFATETAERCPAEREFV